MASHILPVVIVAALAACAQPAPPAATGPAVGIAPVAAGSSEMKAEQNIVFFDSEVFDLNFAKALAQRSDEVHVNFAGPTSLNAFPQRMNVWLAEVKHSNGDVSVEDPKAPKTRAILGVGLIFDIIDTINTMHERKEAAARLAQADTYDARIEYDSATGLAREVVFFRRPPATGPAPVSAPTAAAPAPAAAPTPRGGTGARGGTARRAGNQTRRLIARVARQPARADRSVNDRLSARHARTAAGSRYRDRFPTDFAMPRTR
jgi:hypothetical protein